MLHLVILFPKAIFATPPIIMIIIITLSRNEVMITGTSSTD
jgi:hypothetical protein